MDDFGQKECFLVLGTTWCAQLHGNTENLLHFYILWKRGRQKFKKYNTYLVEVSNQRSPNCGEKVDPLASQDVPFHVNLDNFMWLYGSAGLDGPFPHNLKISGSKPLQCNLSIRYILAHCTVSIVNLNRKEIEMLNLNLFFLFVNVVFGFHNRSWVNSETPSGIGTLY